MKVDQKEIPTRTWEDQLGYHWNNSGTAKGLKESSNRGRAKKVRGMAYAAWRKVAVKTDPLLVWGKSWNKGLSAQEVNILDICPFPLAFFSPFFLALQENFQRCRQLKRFMSIFLSRKQEANEFKKPKLCAFTPLFLMTYSQKLRIALFKWILRTDT